MLDTSKNREVHDETCSEWYWYEEVADHVTFHPDPPS